MVRKFLISISTPGTLAKPFKAVIAAFEAVNPGVTFQDQYGGSVAMVKNITELHQPADLVAVAEVLKAAGHHALARRIGDKRKESNHLVIAPLLLPRRCPRSLVFFGR